MILMLFFFTLIRVDVVGDSVNSDDGVDSVHRKNDSDSGEGHRTNSNHIKDNDSDRDRNSSGKCTAI